MANRRLKKLESLSALPPATPGPRGGAGDETLLRQDALLPGEADTQGPESLARSEATGPTPTSPLSNRALARLSLERRSGPPPTVDVASPVTESRPRPLARGATHLPDLDVFLHPPTAEQKERFLAQTIAFKNKPHLHRQKAKVSLQAGASFLNRIRGSSPQLLAESRDRERIGRNTGDGRPPLCGHFPWTAAKRLDNQQMARYITVQRSGVGQSSHSTAKGPEKFNAHLLRFYAYKVWALPPPSVVISMTGGAANFDLPAHHLDEIMKGRHL